MLTYVRHGKGVKVLYTKLNKNIEKIFSEFNKLNKITKKVLHFGIVIFLAIFALGTVLYVINKSVWGFDLYYDFVATTIIKNSFIVFAEVTVGCLLLDYVFKK